MRLQDPNYLFYRSAEGAASASNKSPRSISEIIADQSSTKFHINAKDSNNELEYISIGWDVEPSLYQIKKQYDDNSKPFLSVLKGRKVLDPKNDEAEIKQVICLLKNRYQNFLEVSGSASAEELFRDPDYENCSAFMSPRLSIPIRDFMEALEFDRVQTPSVKESQQPKKTVVEEPSSIGQALAQATERLTVDQILDSFEAKDLKFSTFPRNDGAMNFFISANKSPTTMPLAINYVLYLDGRYTNSFSSMGAGVGLSPDQSLKLATKLKESIEFDGETSSDKKQKKHSQVEALLEAIKKDN